MNIKFNQSIERKKKEKMRKFLSAALIILFAVSVTEAQLLPLPPVPISPLNNAVNIQLTPVLKWNIVIILGSLSSFRLQVSTNQNFSNIILDSAGIIRDSLKIPSDILESNTQYYWRVNASVIVSSILLTTPFSTAFRFTTGSFTGIEPFGTEIPLMYRLYNNYPNPFNPVTKIRFDIANTGKTELAVYDILGNKLEELVNEDLNAGSYTAEWNATQFSSGVYFCRLSSQDFSETKKMILTK